MKEDDGGGGGVKQSMMTGDEADAAMGEIEESKEEAAGERSQG